jgi:PAS domain S-box-containing protein/putative nucleotidyltransferase with HDIG domain
MSQPVRILYVDDCPLDRDLVRDALAQEQSVFELHEASSRSEFESALKEGEFDLILSDFNILGFQGLQVLDAVHKKDSTIPVIIVTGTGSEEIAVEAMKRGAADYVIKKVHHILRLPYTIKAVLDNKKLQMEKRDSEMRYRLIFENSGEAILLTQPDGPILSANPEACRIFQWSEQEIINLGRDGVVDLHDTRLPSALEERKRTGNFKGELNFKRKDGTIFPGDVSSTIFKDFIGNERTSMIIRDITDRKNAEEKILRQFKYLASLRLIDQTILSTFDVQNSLNALVSTTIMQLQVDAAAVLLLNQNSKLLEYAAGQGFLSKEIKKAKLKLGETHAGKAVLERKLIQIINVQQEPDCTFIQQELIKEAFLSYYGVPLISKGKVLGVLELFHRTLIERDEEWYEFLNALAGQASLALDNAELFNDLQKSNFELNQAYNETIEGWSRALDLRDKETEGHTLRVTEKTLEFALLIGFKENNLEQIRQGALLHDIGKMGVPDTILLKPGPLTDEEWEIMKKHPIFAVDLLSPIQYLKPALDIPYNHHENWDGSGYPRGLKGEQIPLAARLFAMIDVYDALTSDRPYRKAWTKEAALLYIKEQSGIKFDPALVPHFLKMIENENRE